MSDKGERWWTRTQRIRTVAEVPIAVAMLGVVTVPQYQRIALKALHLRRLGLSFSVIARSLDMTGKTVAKAIAWVNDRSLPQGAARRPGSRRSALRQKPRRRLDWEV